MKWRHVVGYKSATRNTTILKQHSAEIGNLLVRFLLVIPM